MSEPFIAEIRVLPFNFTPRGWASCNGQLIPISQNTALFSLLGTTYGGNGQTTFALPNLGAHFVMGTGAGPGLTTRTVGDVVGTQTVSLTSTEMPAHSHGLRAGITAGSSSPAGNAMAPTGVGGGNAYRAPGATTAMAAAAISPAGGSQPHENRQPYLGLNFCIALQGIFPPRN